MACESHGKTSKGNLVTPSIKAKTTQGFLASLQATSHPTPHPLSCQAAAELKQQNPTPMLLAGVVFAFGLGKRGLVLLACFL